MNKQKNIKEILAENVQKYRKLNQLTQAQLAEKSDLSNTYIANIECGKTWISDLTLERIANALNIKIWLLFIDEEKILNTEITKQKNKINIINNNKHKLESFLSVYFDDLIKQLE